MTVAKTLMCAALWLAANLAHGVPLIRPTAIDWQLDCHLPALAHLQPDVLERTQCAIVTVPRNYAAPRQGSLRLYLTRVGARDPLSREGVVFAQPGNSPQANHSGTFAISLAGNWGAHATQAYRTLLNRYDVIELTSRDLNQENGVEHAARDMEFVRAQLDEPQLHYLGSADATRLGNRYATLFPERVARMVLVNTAPGETTAPLVDQLHLREPVTPGSSGCVNQWVGDFLIYGKQPPPSTRCLDPSGWE
jgi:pimeloyl-ACP methyl ester carboxylesterase